MSITTDARADVADKSLEEQGATLDDYLLFDSGAGRAVLLDLLNTYHDRNNDAVEEQCAAIEHPFRLYFIEGQRSVVRQLVACVKAARLARVTGEDENDVQAEIHFADG